MARAELSRGGELADVCPADRAAYLSCRFALHRRQTHASPIHTYSRNLKSEFILRRYLSPNTCRGSDISTSTCCRGAERRVGKFEALPLESMADGSASASGLDFGGGTLDDFTVEKAIGRGHFSVVHRATRNSDAKRVALKKVSIFDTMDAKARERCIKEVKLLQTLPPHPCIIRFEGAFIDSNELYIVFEWAEHGDLRRLLKRAQVMALPQPQPLPLPQPQPLVWLSLCLSPCLSPPLLAPRNRRRTPRCRSRRSGGTLCRSATRSDTCTTRASCTATSSR